MSGRAEVGQVDAANGFIIVLVVGTVGAGTEVATHL